MATLGRNIYFPIYIDIDGERKSFKGLVIRKATVSNTLMSLSDNISGDVYYKNNSLDVSMHEYIIYNDVKYILVNPPTIVREGLASNNSETKGMTKYSFVFYHPMYQLSNLVFTDIAVVNTEERYKSVDKTFSWVGNLQDFIAKLNKNLENTDWQVILSPRVPQGVVDTLSDVLAFDGNSIADALQQMYETWETPFIIDTITPDNPYYILGKRFGIYIGLPSNEIYANEDDRLYNRPFVFRFGKGVGLKNNSATPRNNKIVTRIIGFGSENNIPWGYPQIPWTGNQDWNYTIENDASEYNSYPIYKGIYGGQWVKLIKHPFTRSHLMPTIYAERVNKKVNPYADGYDPTIELIDYYDADDAEIYPNTIVLSAPSTEIHQFEDIKPELGEEHILSAVPIGNDMQEQSEWIDTIDDDGNYVQSYFKIKIPQLDFDIYACAALTQEMQINMRSGACIGCTFTVQIDWDDYKNNFYDEDGNFVPDGEKRDLTKYPRSDRGEIELILQKETQTFGVIMPNVYQNPKSGDEFVILGISLPTSYITNAQTRLDDAMKSYMLENNVHYFDYPLKFDEKFLYDNTNILSQIKNNTAIRFEFAGQILELFVKQITIKYGQGVLPQYDITLTDDIDVVLNQISQAQKEIGKINSILSALQQDYDRNVWYAISQKLSKVKDDVAHGKIIFNSGFHSNNDGTFGDWAQAASGAGIYKDEQGNWHIESDFLHARKKLTARELQIEEVKHIGGQIMLTAAECEADFVVEYDNYYRCFFLKKDNDGKTINNKWKVGDQAFMQSFNVEKWSNNDNGNAGDNGLRNRYYWRLVVGIDNANNQNIIDANIPDGINIEDYHWIDLSKTDCATMSDAPMAEDKIVQLGNQAGEHDRENAIAIVGAGSSSPYIDEYVGITTFHLPTPETRLKPGENVFTGLVNMKSNSTYGGKALSEYFNGYDVTINNIENNLAEMDKDVDEMSKSVEEFLNGIDGLTSGNENLLRNTAFTGDYLPMDVAANNDVDSATPMYSDPLQYWDNDGVTVIANIVSASGFSAKINGGHLAQRITKDLNVGGHYCISFRAKGSIIKFTFGGATHVILLDNTVKRYTTKIQATDANANTFQITNADAEIMEIMLTEGNIPNTGWEPSPLDNDKTLAYYQNLTYLANAITNASTSILGGLILTQMIRVGNYRDGNMVAETGGMSGLYANDNSPFLWGGGDLEKAFYTINKYVADPSYQATDEEVADMAKFVVTHGGRAILNDIVLRGYVYAKGGVFNGDVYANNGVFNGTIHARAGDFTGEEGMFKFDMSADERAIVVSGPTDVLNNELTPAEGAQQVEYMRLGAWFARPRSISHGYLMITPRLVARTVSSDGETILQMSLDAMNGLSFGSNQGATHATYNNYTIGGASISQVIFGALPTNPDLVPIGGVWNDNGTLKIKTE